MIVDWRFVIGDLQISASDFGHRTLPLVTLHSSLATAFLALISLHPARPHLEFAILNLRSACCPIQFDRLPFPLGYQV
jgi:hypothetical protein